ncbi:MAG: UDP-N-acetylmuramate dehydrogenase [Chitinivibrionia bacterium]|nr:UDP-N-acetylmuramate dehydrogenase [Chitinivibrionia bacterium]
MSEEIQTDVFLSDKTSAGYKIGGKADYYIDVHSAQDIKNSIKFAKQKNIPYFIMGNGSNLLVSDKGFRGLVVCTRKMDNILVFDNAIRAEAGASISAFVKEAIKANFFGTQELSGIPGTVGAALVMNAGAYSQTISDFVTKICFYDCDSDAEVIISKEEANFGYRSSVFQKKNGVIFWADFEFNMKKNYEILLSAQNEILKKRKENQPLEYHSCGSVFKRPQNNYAGKLIEEAGLKGFCIGDAQVSEKHANFIVNKKNATAEDVRKVMAKVRKTVKEKFQVILEPEVVFLGDFDDEI